jgi:uncharacterized membrane protein
MALLFPLAMVIGSGWFRSFWGRLAGSSGRLPPRSTAFRPMLLFILAAFFFIAGLSWYYFTSSGINFTRLIDFWTQHSAYITSGSLQAATPNLLSNPAGIFSGRDALVRTAIGLDFAGVSLQGQVFRVLQLTIQALLVLGIFYFILRPARFRFVPEFLAFCTVSTLILAACIILPGFAERFNTTRMFHLALLTLSPFVIIGCLAAWELAVLLVKTLSGSSIMRPASRFDAAAWGPPLICTVIIIPYYILCSGLVFEISGQSVTDRVDTPYSIALSRYRLDLSSSFSAADGAAASWLAGNSRRGAKIYTDHHTPRLLELMSVPCHCETLNQESRCTPGDYAFLSGWNISQGKLTYATYPGVRQYLSLVDFPLLDATRTIFDRIYNNGAAQVLCIPP